MYLECMRLPRIALAAALAVGSAALVACGADSATGLDHDAAAHGAPSAGPTKRVSVPWAPVSVGPAGRTLTIRYRSAACSVGPARVEREESARAVTIRVVQSIATSPNVSCAAVAGFPLAHVPLRHRLGGRALRGGVGTIGPVPAYRTVATLDSPHPDIRLPLVPNVVELTVKDAVHALAGDGLHAHVAGGEGEVVAQHPAAGQLAPGTSRSKPFGGVVTLVARG
jgi:hypothetical protein